MSFGIMSHSALCHIRSYVVQDCVVRRNVARPNVVRRNVVRPTVGASTICIPSLKYCILTYVLKIYETIMLS